MVAAGATVLMATNEESSSNGTNSSSTRYESQSSNSRCNEIQCGQQSSECSNKRNLAPCTSENKDKSRTHTSDKTNRLSSKVENKNGSKHVTLHKTTPIRETRTSRLRAASNLSPSGNTAVSRRSGVSESSSPWNLQPSTSLSSKERKYAQESPISSDNSSTMNTTRERDKSYKRKSYLNRSLNAEVAPPDRSNHSEQSERRSRRQSSKQSHISEVISTSDSGVCRQTATNLHRKHLESKVSSPKVGVQYNTNRSKVSNNSVGMKCLNTQRTSDGHSDSEVSRRVDALTALTKATMERVERLTSQAGLSVGDRSRAEAYSMSESSTENSVNILDTSLPCSPSKSSILKRSSEEYGQDGNIMRPQHTPVSILKHKDNDVGQSSSNSSHTTLPVTFSPSVQEPVHKRHGILKKRSSLDESEILRRRSCSPDVSFADNSYSEFRPILKNQRRSSLDEIVKRDQSPDQPTSILKRKSSREDDREDRQLGSPEPQGILKRKSISGNRTGNSLHHVTIAPNIPIVTGNEVIEGSEVRPILKKKHSREESSGNDPPSMEPRPILKKKSSTESDEHDDRPKKTILKCSRKSSQEDCNSEIELSSPKKSSVLRNRVLQSRASGMLDGDCVRPILKQGSSRDNDSRVRLNMRDATIFGVDVNSEDLFLRKRAQSVGHVQSSHSNELNTVLSKRRSLESSLFVDTLEERLRPKLENGNVPLKLGQVQCKEVTSTSVKEISISTTAETESSHKAYNKDKQTMFEMQERVKVEPHVFSINSSADKDNTMHSTEPSDNKKIDSMASADKKQEKEKETCESQENYSVHRCNSVSKMALHFKALQERAQSSDKDNNAQRVQRKASHGVQRYRERKVQGNDRFNTQPVTFQEVQEAVLQNQRIVQRTDPPESQNATDEEFDPSKLSLLERVRLFDQKISTEKAPAVQQRRRPATRYKTQPVTSEEVEVASRILPLNAAQLSGLSQESQSYSLQSSGPQSDLPKSILKSSTSHAYGTARSKSPELEGLKLIKSVLKRESEEQQQQQQQTPENCDIFPRSILKTNSLSKYQESDSSYDNREPDRRDSVQNKNINIDGKQREPIAIEIGDNVQYDAHCDKKECSTTDGAEIKQRFTVPFYKNIVTQDQASGTNDIIGSIDNVQALQAENAVSRRQKREVDVSSSANRTSLASDDETSSSNGREVRSIIKNEAIQRRRQAILAKQARSVALSKSASHHAISSESESVQDKSAVGLPGLCRSATQTIPTELNDGPSMSIADRLAALRRSGNTNWKQRINSESAIASECISSKEDLTVKQSVLADCLGKLESATEGWKKRIAASDVSKFTVAGKMKIEQVENVDVGPSSPLIEVTGNILDRKKMTPRLERFKGRKGDTNDTVSTPTSPNKNSVVTRRSFSEPASDDSGEENKAEQDSLPTVPVPKADDETFTSFFTSISLEKCETENIQIDESVFDAITSHSELLVQKRNIRTQRRRAASRNPIKALAARTDLKSEYTEIKTGIAERVMRSLNVEKLAKNSSLAVEALAGLASTEDFSNITLRNVTDMNGSSNKMRPYKDLMLILIKGRRHVQVRLVEPVVESINSGDNFVLVTKSEVYNYIGKFSNVIEKARGAEVALSIQQNKDLGCQASQVITINEDKLTCSKSQLQKFWNYLGADSETMNVIDGGHPDEDELYESAIIDTNMVYEMKEEELVPFEKYWGVIPKIEMLDPSKVLVFDFGTEMYVWSGKGASFNEKRIATRLATELWNEGYDYTECAVCPITTSNMIGNRKSPTDIKRATKRPSWCVFAKLTQHVETVLFREKFLDWPNVSGIIRVKDTQNKEETDGTIIVEPCDINELLEPNKIPVDLVLEGSHLGRGTGWYDDELMKQYVVTSTSVTVWHIDEFSHTLLDNSSKCHFYTGDSYIVRWMYSVTITGRELSGLPSKHAAKGRDRSVYFIWQGQCASLNEQGAAALLTVELDLDQGPQIRVVEGFEPAAFLNLFAGGMVVHRGKKAENKRDQRWRLYICRGTLETETMLFEVPCSARQLRSRGSLVLTDTEDNKIYVWHGSNALPHIRQNALHAAAKLKENPSPETGLTSEMCVTIHTITEGEEPDEFFTALGGSNKKLYMSLESSPIQDHTPRLFYLSSISKEFKPTELLCPHRADLPTPFPFLQDELYQVSQPALFLCDNKNEIWIWQGWWPDTGAEDQSGSKAVRWQGERRAAMTVAMQYWQNTHPGAKEFPIYLVWAGLEPLQFINLFPVWTYRDDIAELNIKDGRNPGEVLTVESELARLTQSTYPPAQLLQRPLPEGVDPTRLELYLSHQHFQELLGMSKEEFQELPVWKQVNLKKEIGLF